MTDKKTVFPATVVSVIDDHRVVINRGLEQGIKKGQRFLVYALGEEVFDPETDESLGRIEIVRGTGFASHVQDKITTVTSDAKEKPSRRTVRRSDPASFIMGRSEEVVEEPGVELPFEDPGVGDLAKPV